jgi:hypothetical protein
MFASEQSARRGRRAFPGGAVFAALLVVLLDATFNLYFWRIPKLTPRGVDYGYQFLVDVHALSRPEPSGTVRVVAFGSSVAKSFDPGQVQELLTAAAPAAHVRVYRLLLPGIKPSDYELFFAAMLPRLHPDVAVLLLNLVDFLNPSFERDVKPQVEAVLPPWPTLRRRHAYMAPAEQLDLALASVSNLYRYRKQIRSCVQDHVKLAVRWLRARPPRAGYGFYADGYTRQDFGLRVDGRRRVDLDYYVHPAWIAQRGRAVLDFSLGGRRLVERVETTPGWKTVHLVLPAHHGRLLQVTSDGAWNPRAAGLGDDVRLLGIKVRAVPRGALGRVPPLHYPPLEEDGKLLRMGDAVGPAYVARWQRLLAGRTAFARRFRAYRREELGVAAQRFTSTGEYAELERLVANLSRHGVAVVLINNPESPLLFGQYAPSAYYQAHVRFLRGLAARYPGVRFYDLTTALPAEDFNDWHHVNFIGAIKLGPRFAAVVRQAIAERQARRRRAS